MGAEKEMKAHYYNEHHTEGTPLCVECVEYLLARGHTLSDMQIEITAKCRKCGNKFTTQEIEYFLPNRVIKGRKNPYPYRRKKHATCELCRNITKAFSIANKMIQEGKSDV